MADQTPDRDYCTEGEEFRLTDEQLRRLTAYVHPDEATDYVRGWLHSVAAELLDARAEIAALRNDLDAKGSDFDAACQHLGEARERITELEAQQQAPVAYTVIHRLPDGEVAFTNRYYLDRVHADQRAADDGAAYSVVELREVSGDE